MLMSLLRFGLLSGLSLVVSVGLTVVLHEAVGMLEEWAFGISLVVVFAVNFVACKYWVFEGKAGDLKRQLVIFALSSAGFRLAEYLGFLLVHTVLGVYYLWAMIGLKSAVVLSKFFYYRAVVFRSPSGRSSR